MTDLNDYLNDLKGSLEADSEVSRSKAISEGLKNLKGKISSLDLTEGRKSDLGKWAEGIKKAPTPQPDSHVGLADRAINMYKTNIKPAVDSDDCGCDADGKTVYTKAQVESMKAAARALAGQRSSGDVGKQTQSGPNGGNLGKETINGQNGGDIGRAVGNPAFSAGVTPGNLTVGESKEESLEDYRARIFESFGLTEAEKPFPYGKVGDKLRQLDTERKSETDPKKRNKLYSRRQKVSKEYNVPMESYEHSITEVHNTHKGQENYKKEKEEGRYGGTKPSNERVAKLMKKMKEEVAALEAALNLLEDVSWQQVDKCSREVAIAHGTTLKALNKAFREHFGQYPDKWIAEQVIAEECGAMPLAEVARIAATGLLYDVTMMWRGKTIRVQFFWPEAGRPSSKCMQNAVQKFYPSARLLTYYPSRDQDAGSFIMVPPMSESYVALDESDWVELDEAATMSYQIICEELGEPVFGVWEISEGTYGVLVSDHDTGEEITVTFGEGILDMFKDKRSPEEKKHAKMTKMAKELDRLQAHAKDSHSDVSKGAAKAAKSPAKAAPTKRVFARKQTEKKPVVAAESATVTLRSKELRVEHARREAFLLNLHN